MKKLSVMKKLSPYDTRDPFLHLYITYSILICSLDGGYRSASGECYIKI